MLLIFFTTSHKTMSRFTLIMLTVGLCLDISNAQAQMPTSTNRYGIGLFSYSGVTTVQDSGQIVLNGRKSGGFSLFWERGFDIDYGLSAFAGVGITAFSSATRTEYNPLLLDSLGEDGRVSVENIMPLGFFTGKLGVDYSIWKNDKHEFRLGAGLLALYSGKRIVTSNTYQPTSSPSDSVLFARFEITKNQGRKVHLRPEFGITYEFGINADLHLGLTLFHTIIPEDLFVGTYSILPEFNSLNTGGIIRSGGSLTGLKMYIAPIPRKPKIKKQSSNL
jgi:hypothetical protein